MEKLYLIRFENGKFALQGTADPSNTADFSLYDLVDGEGGDPFAFGNRTWEIVEDVTPGGYDANDSDSFWDAVEFVRDQISESYSDNYDVLEREQLEEGGPNDHPNCVFKIRHQYTGKEGWVAGPHGTSCCAIFEWLYHDSNLAETKEEAIEDGCDFTAGDCQ